MQEQKFIVESILRPKKNIEAKMKKDIKNHIFSKFESKIYTDSKEINEIIKYDMDFYMNNLEKNIKMFDKNELIEIALNEYEKTSKIVMECKYDFEFEKIVNDLGWRELGPIFRRAMKFIAEKALMLNSKGIKLTKLKKEKILSEIFISAEEIAKRYMNSEAVHKIFPDESSLILQEDNDIFWDLKCKNREFMDRFDQRKNVFSGYNFGIVEDEVKEIELVLGKTLKSEVGFTYQELIDIFVNIINENGQYGVKKILKIDLLNKISKEYNIDKLKIEKILNGFRIEKNELINEKREIYKPKQEHRALYRGIFEVEENNKIYFTWSTGMAIENLMLMMDKFKFQYIPGEWKNEILEKASTGVSNIFGRKFELLVKEEFSKKGIVGNVGFLKGIGELKIPADVGEIDYIGVDFKKKEIILGECKYITQACEPRYWSDDIDKFTKKKGYVAKFKKKIEFIESNFDTVKINLKKEFKVDEDLDKFALRMVLITYYPTIMELLCKDFDVENLSWFIDKY